MMICLVDLPELSRVITVEDDASRSMQRFFMETSAIYSLSCSVILLLLGDSFVVLKPVDVLVYFDHRICRDKQKERE